jgi:excisionase family DNA binding protein
MTTTGKPTAPALLVDAREAARLLGISTRTLWTLTDRGELPAVRIGSRVLYRVEALRQYAERMEGQR